MIDPEVVRNAQEGDGAAMNEVLQYALPLVRKVVAHVLGADAEAVEDVAQLSLLKIWRKLDLYRAGNFDAWVKRIAQFTAYDYQRDVRPSRLVSYEDLEFRMAGDCDPVRTTLDAAAYAAVVALIDEIPADYQSTVKLLYVEGFSMLEAAAELGLKLNTLKTRSFRGRMALRERLIAKGDR